MISQIESDKANPSYKVLELIAARLEMPLEFFLADIQTQMEQHTRYKASKALIGSGNYDKAVQLIEPMLSSLASNLNEGNVRLDLGISFLHLDRLEDAKDQLLKAEKLFAEKGNAAGQVQSFLHVGLVFSKLKKIHKSLYYWYKARELFEFFTFPEPFLQSEVLRKIAWAQQSLGEHDEAQDMYREAYKVLNKTNRMQELGLTLMEIGEAYIQTREYEKASEYSQSAHAIFSALKNIKLNVAVHLQYGICLRDQGQHQEAFAVFQKCVETCIQYQFHEDVVPVYVEIARAHYIEKQYETALGTLQQAFEVQDAGADGWGQVWKLKGLVEKAMGNTQAALLSFLRAAEMFGVHQHPTELAEVYKEIAGLYECEGNLEMAMRYLRKMDEARMNCLRDRGIVLG